MAFGQTPVNKGLRRSFLAAMDTGGVLPGTFPVQARASGRAGRRRRSRSRSPRLTGHNERLPVRAVVPVRPPAAACRAPPAGLHCHHGQRVHPSPCRAAPAGCLLRRQRARRLSARLLARAQPGARCALPPPARQLTRIGSQIELLFSWMKCTVRRGNVTGANLVASVLARALPCCARVAQETQADARRRYRLCGAAGCARGQLGALLRLRLSETFE